MSTCGRGLSGGRGWRGSDGPACRWPGGARPVSRAAVVAAFLAVDQHPVRVGRALAARRPRPATRVVVRASATA